MTRETNNITKDQFSVGTKGDALHTTPEGGMDSDAVYSAIALEEQGQVPYMQSDKSRTNQAFWLLQTLGWVGYVSIRFFSGALAGLDYIGISLTAALSGFTLSIIMRYIYQRIKGSSLWIILPTVLVLTAFFGMAVSGIEVFFWREEFAFGRGLVNVGEYIEAFYWIIDFEGRSLLFGNTIFESVVLFSWSSLYFGFHYYDDLQKQRQKALKATALAQQAQLTMLRYQLNPHFLFNTLNAISTLVLESDGKNANRMLTKLSTFLRYTLVNQPTQKVSLEQELTALGLYLEIEKVRFEARLNIVYEVTEEAKEALIPSLILQPHIENAVKYAIAPSETGGTLRIIGRIDGRHLVMSVEDDGPGMEDPEKPISKSSSGVGIVNTRDRLEQIYGDQHTFLIQNIKPEGLRVWMKIPFEKEADDSAPLEEKEG